MESILLVSGSDKSRAQLAELLDVSASGRLVTAESGSEARRLLLTGEFSLVVINAPLPDEFGSDLSVYAAHHTAAGVVLLVGSSLADQVGARVESDGVFLVPKPISRSLFSQTLKLALAAHWRITGLKKENLQLKSRIEEIRMVDRAKCILIQYLNMTEPQAHRYIEKQAMDLRVSRREIAQGILQTYES